MPGSVSSEHVLVFLQESFAKLMDNVLGFFVADSRCLCVSIALDCSLSVSLSFLSTRKGVT